MPTLTVDANIKDLCGKLAKNSAIDPALYEKYHIKRGLRNSDGTGVKAGITNICNVHGYLLNEGELELSRVSSSTEATALPTSLKMSRKRIAMATKKHRSFFFSDISRHRQSLNGSTTLSPKTAIFRAISLKI